MNLCQKLWNQASWYDDIAANIPSDIPGYQAFYDALNVSNDTDVVDFGCHKGASTKRIEHRGANVIGVDKSAKSISEARKTYEDIDFVHVLPDDPIPVTQPYDVVTATFVHPTIRNKDELQKAFNKSGGVLKEQGRLGLLGLHPHSLDSSKSYVNYKHRLSEEASYQDEQLFQNEIHVDDETFSFPDTCWTEQTLASLLQQAGFDHVESYGLNDNTMSAEARHLTRRVAEAHDIAWQDEYEPGRELYHVTIAHKHGTR